MLNYEKHSKIIKMVGLVQESEEDQRAAVKEAKLFLYKRDGQWDPYAWEKLDGTFRGTFDMCTPIVDQISGEIDQSNFTLKIDPVSGDASKKTAKTINGLIRNILNISNADQIISTASRSNVIGGFDCLEVVQADVDGDSFDQDLLIKRVPNAVDSVWFDQGSVLQDRSDSKWAVKLTAVTIDDYSERWKKGSKVSVGQTGTYDAYQNKAETITVGKLYYRKNTNVEIVRMTDGSVLKVDDDFKKIADELANPTPDQNGITPQPITIEKDNDGNEKRRTRKSSRVWTRMFDGGDWLQDEEETVFDYIPLVPMYGNFEIIENKPIYFGKIEGMYDEQRGLNYAVSRDIDDGSLSPKPAIWMTEKQAAGRDYSTMNTDKDAVRLYNADPEAPAVNGQSYTGGAVASSGLQTTIANMQQMIATTSNTFSAGQGNALAGQSGIAGGQQIDQGNIGSIKWFESVKTTMCHVGKVMITNALARTYDSTRQSRILEEDGTSSIVPLNKRIFDDDTQTIVELNNLSIGEYDVVCDYGPAFNSKQKETAQAFLDMAAIDPSIAQKGMDIWLKNLAVPGMDQLAERSREELVNAGIVIESQLTDEERNKIQQQQQAAQGQPQQPDPNMLIAQAEMTKAQAEQQNAQNKQAEIQGNQQIQMQELQLKQQQLQLDAQKFQMSKDDKFNVDAAKIQQGERKLDQSELEIQMKQQSQQFQNALATRDQQMAEQAQQVENLSKAINQMKGIREASGADAIVGDGVIDNFKTQSDIVRDEQRE